MYSKYFASTVLGFSNALPPLLAGLIGLFAMATFAADVTATWSTATSGTAALWGVAVLIGVTASCRRRRALLVVAGLSLVLLSHQTSRAQQVIPNLLGNDFTDPPSFITVTAGDQANSPTDEKPPMAVDNTRATKWLAFQPNGTFYQIQFNGGVQRAVNAYTISSANDAPERDPYAWTLSGSNDGTTFTPIETRTNQDFVTRFETQVFTFTNNDVFNMYRFHFQTALGAMVPGAPSTDAIQLSEIELFRFVPGDFNFDGSVDAADYVVWRKTDGSPAGFNLWRAHFGQSAGSGADASATATVPEPVTLVLILMGMAAISTSRRVAVS